LSVALIESKKRDAQYQLKQARGVYNRADTESRSLSESERNQVNGWMSEYETILEDIKNLERMEGFDSDSIASRVAESEAAEASPNGHQPDTVQMDLGDGSPDSRRSAADEDEIDPYQQRFGWDGGGGAEHFQDMSLGEQRQFIRAAATRDYNMAFYSYLKKRGYNQNHMVALENTRTMVEGVDADGGYLAPTQLVAGILREAQVLEELKPRMDVIRSNARSLTYTKGLDAIVMGWVAELGTKPEDQLSFGRVVLVPNVGAVVIWVSDELLEDESFGLQGYMQARVAEAKTLLEEEAFVSGSGSGRPFGILTRLNAEGGTPNRYTTGAASGGSIANFSDDIIKIPYTMKVQYRRNGVYILGTNAIRLARLQRDASGGAGTGGYMWQPSLQEGEPDRLNGYPVIETTSVALNSAIATGNDIGIFGDLRRYRVFERLGLQVRRLEELRALTDEVGFRFRFRTGGDVMLNEAFRTIRAG